MRDWSRVRAATFATLETLGVEKLGGRAAIQFGIGVAVLAFVWLTGRRDDALSEIWARVGLTVIFLAVFPMVFVWHYLDWATKLKRQFPGMSGILIVAVVLTILMAGAWLWVYLDYARGPIIWTYGDGPHPIYGMHGNYPMRPVVRQFQITGLNRSNDPVSGIEAVVRSDATGKSYPGYFLIAGKYVLAGATKGVPPHTEFMLVFPLTNDPAKFGKYQLDADAFLAEFAPLTLKVTYEGRGSPYVKRFTKADLAKPLDDFDRFLRDAMQREKPLGITAK